MSSGVNNYVFISGDWVDARNVQREFRGDYRPVYTVTDELDRTPTVEKLNELMARYPRFDLATLGRCKHNSLGIAVSKRALPLVQAILDKDPSLVDKQAQGAETVTCLAYAAALGDLNVVEAFVSRGAKVNLANHSGITPLFQAARHGHTLVTQFLLAEGGVIYLEAFNSENVKKDPGIINAVRANIEEAMLEAFQKGTVDAPTDRLPVEVRTHIAGFCIGDRAKQPL
jgi:hypothetical protein